MSKYLPDQVKKQSAAIQELYTEMHQGSDPAAENAAAPNSTTDKPVTTEVGVIDPPEDKSKGKGKKSEEEDFKQKYLTLQGMFNSEVPKLRAEKAATELRLQNMEALLAGMNSGAVVADPLKVEVGSIVTADDEKEYGESIAVMRRVSREEMQPLLSKLAKMESIINNLNTEVMPRVDRVVRNQAQTAEQQFWDKIEEGVPNWKSINNNEDFISWMFGTAR